MTKTTISRSTAILANIVAPAGLLLILAATAVPFFLMHCAWAQTAYPFVYATGALLLLAARLFARYDCTDERLRRLHRMEKWSPILFIAAICLLFYSLYYDNMPTLRDWLAFTLAGAFLQVYTSIAIPRREAKLAGEK